MSRSQPAEHSLEPIGLPVWWAQQRSRTPDHVAIISDGVEWTYQELDQSARVFAERLMDAGVGRGDHVGLCVDRSAEAIAAMLGVMQTGAAFVPLDPELPSDRLSFMIADASIEFIIGHSHYQPQFRKHAVSWLDCDKSIRHQSTANLVNEPPRLQPEDVAYVMYTSGSTGKPKGVQIPHSALAAYCDADIECYQLTEKDRTLQFSTLCFDIAIEEIFPPLLTGGCIVIRPRARAEHANELSAIIEQFEVTAVHLATAYWHSWVDLMVATRDRVPKCIRLMIATGEKVSVEHYRRWQSVCDHSVLWCNAYGPTETTVTATVYIPDEAFNAAQMPIGKPLKHYTAYILDDQLRPVQGNATGQLVIGGAGLAKGYLNRPELTESAFVETSIDGEIQRIYLTGDLARWLPDGNLDFAGRVDHQIKLGSYRIEPGEIEAVIDRAHDVLGSLVVHDEVDGDKFLMAYVACGKATLSAGGLRESLRDSLPRYMIPNRYIFIESFPKTINGKIDRAALPSPNQCVVAHDGDATMPRDDLERRLVDLWQDVLNVPEIGIHEDFFLLGGSSLLVTRLVAKLTTEMKIELPVRDFFANPTVATLAGHLRRLLGQTETHPIASDTRRLRERLPLVETGFFPSDLHQLYFVHYRPRNDARGQAVVLCHPMGHEYARSYRNLQQLAVQLSQLGFDVLRFDFAGSGNSEGDCGEFTADRMTKNIIDAHGYLLRRTQASHVFAVGLRLGATALASLPRPVFEQCVLWDPVYCGKSMLRRFDRFHRRQLRGLTRFNKVRRASAIDQSYGHLMTTEKRQSLSALELRELDRSFPLVLTDGAFASIEEQHWLDRQPTVHRVADTIDWEDERYTESAFSSPQSYRVIASLLQRESSK
ncbi:amino acid adenylation domain-containing protein [Novipirellula artificiosorum]|uniref:Tyrocidine synthase 3 n=1 Tax=Novipirellula artificiosorum TaxID=2528016 RepID=A0A5C6D3Y0_9BACT|nr:amino acid adenylation domain-containing protein [Novipirellula artificiosorum]TWU31520.1 Tyrocidine synthase 3 [Novipirellula artificiosorum]